MKRWHLVFSSLVLIGLMAPASFADSDGPELAPAPFEPAEPGTRMAWQEIEGSGAGESVIGRADGYELHWQWEGEPRSGYLFCSFCGSTRFDEQAYGALWPLEVGKSVSFWRNKDGSRWQDEIEVIGTDSYELPGGPVPVYVVRWSSQAYSHRWSGETTTLYAPSVGWSVRFEHADNEGRSWAWRLESVGR